MILQELRDARLGEPFRPFSIQLTDGRELPVLQPESVAIGSAIAIVADEHDAFVFLEPEQIKSICYRGNGKDRSRRRRKS